MSPAWPPIVSTQPKTTSSTAPGSMPVRSTSALSDVRRRGRPGGPGSARRPGLPDGRADGVDDVGLRHGGCSGSSQVRSCIRCRGLGRHGHGARRRRPRHGRAPGPLQEQVQVVLDRVADGAVALERLARPASAGRVGRQRLGHRHVAARASGRRWPATTRPGRRAGAANCELRARRRRGGASPPGSEPIGTPNCLPLGHVVDGEVEHPPAEPDAAARRCRARPGRTRARPPPASPTGRRRAEVRDPAGAPARRRPTPTGSSVADGLVRRVTRAVARDAEQHDRRRVHGHERRRRDGCTVAVAEPSTDGRRRRERAARRRTRVSTNGCGQRGVAGLLGQQHPVELGRARARRAPRARRCRARPSRPARPTRRRPGRRRPGASPVGAVGIAVGPRGPHDLGRALLGEQVAHGVAEGELVVGEGEAHRLLLPRAGRDALGDDVALDLVRAGVDRPGQRELPALRPRPVELGVGRRAGRARSRAGRRRARTRRSSRGSTPAPAGRPSTVPVTVWSVCSRYASARIHARTTRSRSTRVAGRRPVRGRRAASAAARNRPGERSVSPRSDDGGRHRDRPALAHLAEHDATGDGVVGDEGVVEEHLGEALVAVEPAEAAHGDARRCRAGRGGR